MMEEENNRRDPVESPGDTPWEQPEKGPERMPLDGEDPLENCSPAPDTEVQPLEPEQREPAWEDQAAAVPPDHACGQFAQNDFSGQSQEGVPRQAAPAGAAFPEAAPGPFAAGNRAYGDPTPQKNAPMGFYPPPYDAPGQPAPYPHSPTGYPAAPAYFTSPQPWGVYPPPVQPKKKMSRGIKVFLWIASALAAGAIMGFAGFLIYSGVSSNYTPPYTLPAPSEGVPEEREDPPEYDDGVTPPEDREDDSDRPQIDLTPNETGITIEKKPEGEELSAQGVYEKVAKSTVTVSASLTKNGQEATGTGTGIIATEDGYIITNSHVVFNSKSTAVKVIAFDGEEYDAVVVGVDRTTDLAVIKTNDYHFTPAQFGDAGELHIGEWVIAIGNPGGERFSSSLTRGVISGLDRTVGQYSENGMTYIQTDAAINPGNSGGPLLNMYGQVVGINSSKIITEGYEGMGFAIPVSKAKNILDELLSGGYVKGRTRLGIQGQDVSAMQSMYGLPKGFLIMGIDEDSSFSGTQAQQGDIITAIDGKEVSGLSDIANLLLKYSPGDEVTVTLYRISQSAAGLSREFDVKITLLEDKGETQN